MLEGEVVVPEGFQVEMTRRAALLLLGRVEVDEVGVRVVRAHLRPRSRGSNYYDLDHTLSSSF